MYTKNRGHPRGPSAGPQTDYVRAAQLILVRQSGTPFRTTTSQHLAAVGRAHSLAEAGFLASLALLGLISSEHFVHLACTIFADIRVEYNYILFYPHLSIDFCEILFPCQNFPRFSRRTSGFPQGYPRFPHRFQHSLIFFSPFSLSPSRKTPISLAALGKGVFVHFFGRAKSSVFSPCKTCKNRV